MDERPNDNAPGEPGIDEASAPDSSSTDRAATPESAASGLAAEQQERVGDTNSPALAAPGWRPADYYAAPRHASRLPKWIPLTCGVLAIVAIGLMALAGVFLQSGGLGKLVAIAFGQMSSDAERMFEDGVAPDARAGFRKSLLAVRDGIADGTIELQAALPLLQEMQKATRDGRLSADEVEGLTGSFDAALARPAGDDPSEPRSVDL